MANRAAIFIDGAYLDYVLRDEFGLHKPSLFRKALTDIHGHHALLIKGTLQLTKKASGEVTEIQRKLGRLAVTAARGGLSAIFPVLIWCNLQRSKTFRKRYWSRRPFDEGVLVKLFHGAKPHNELWQESEEAHALTAP